MARNDKGASEIQNKKNKEHRTIRAKPKQEIQKTEINNLKQKGKVMKGKQGIIYCVFALMITHVANAETCVKTTFNVTYGCGDGTVAGTLPADATAEYNKSFTPTSLTSSICTAPDGYKINGYSVYINDIEMAFFTSSSFTYTFAADCEIRPNYVRGSDIATPEVLAVNLGVSGSSYTYVASDYTWSTVFPYGTVNGVAKCSTIKPENTASGYSTGLIASDQDAIESAANSGRYCYCKMTEPDISGSPWVFDLTYGSASDCASLCAIRCGNHVRGNVAFRASVFAAAIAEVTNNN